MVGHKSELFEVASFLMTQGFTAFGEFNSEGRQPLHQAIELVRLDDEAAAGQALALIRALPASLLQSPTAAGGRPSGLPALHMAAGGSDHVPERCGIITALLQRLADVDGRDAKEVYRIFPLGK